MMEILIPMALGAVITGLWASAARTSTPNNQKKDDGSKGESSGTLLEVAQKIANNSDEIDKVQHLCVPVGFELHGPTTTDGETLTPRARALMELIFGVDKGFTFDPPPTPPLSPPSWAASSKTGLIRWRTAVNVIFVSGPKSAWVEWLARQDQR